MASLLLALIYIAFISLGLPDSLLGSAWFVMREEMGVPLSFAGIVSIIISCGTIVSSLLSDRTTKRLGAGWVVAISVLMTAAAMIGFSFSNHFWLLCLFAIPYGLGAGGIDAALNNYVALHYSSRHMNWLHCCWGVGAAISPFIMGYSLTGGFGWQGGYRTVGIFQVILAAVLFAALPLWIKNNARRARAQHRGHIHKATCTSRSQTSFPANDIEAAEKENAPVMKLPQVLRIRGVIYVLSAFFAYCALEWTAILWASSYLIIHRGINPEMAASFASYFLIGMTAGRFLSGFIADKIGDKNMIRWGIWITAAGIVAVLLPVAPNWVCLGGLMLIGLGCAPIYPAIIHATPVNFGKENSQAVIGVQMAVAYTGSLTAPPLFGLIANHISIGLYPVYLLIFMAVMLLMTEKLNKVVGKKEIIHCWQRN